MVICVHSTGLRLLCVLVSFGTCCTNRSCLPEIQGKKRRWAAGGGTTWLTKLRFINLLIIKQFPSSLTENDDNKNLIMNANFPPRCLRLLDVNIVYCCACCQLSFHCVFPRHVAVVDVVNKLANSLPFGSLIAELSWLQSFCRRILIRSFD